jgi:hypothetical protein
MRLRRIHHHGKVPLGHDVRLNNNIFLQDSYYYYFISITRPNLACGDYRKIAYEISGLVILLSCVFQSVHQFVVPWIAIEAP